MYFTIYQTTCLTSGWIYIGKHQTEDLNDGYLGSGKLLKQAIDHFGLQNFSKEILHIFESEEEMNQKEAELVTEEFCAQPGNFNLCPGGKGGWGYINQNLTNGFLGKSHSKDSSNRISIGIKNWISDNPEEFSTRMKKAYAKRIVDGSTPSFKGKSHTEETKRKMSEKAKEIFSDPSRNSQFGTMWITNGTENKKIKKSDSIPDGYRKGRIKAGVID